MFGVDDAALALLASGAISTAGGLYSNYANRKAQAHINDINWQVAAQNNATQINMANTAHQREVADLRAAGLNPILSSGGNGAPTPALTSPRGDVARVDNPLEGLASSARGLASYISDAYKASVRQQVADANYSEHEAMKNSWSVPNARLESQLDLQKMQLEQDALMDLTTKSYRDSRGVWHRQFDPDSEYFKEFKEGMLASAKDAANVNWRNNLKSGLDTVNTAASLGFGIGKLRHATKLLNLQREEFEWRKSRRK